MDIRKIKYNGKPVEALYSQTKLRIGFKTETKTENNATITETVYLDKELTKFESPNNYVYLLSQHTIERNYDNTLIQNLADDIEMICDEFEAITEE